MISETKVEPCSFSLDEIEDLFNDRFSETLDRKFDRTSLDDVRYILPILLHRIDKFGSRYDGLQIVGDSVVLNLLARQTEPEPRISPRRNVA